MTDNTDAIKSRLAFHGLTPAMAQLLRDNKAYVLSALPAALDQFYAHMAEFPDAMRFFGSPERVAHARSKQLEHWTIILDGHFDENYVRSVTQVGEVHHRIGLEPKWYIGGYSFLLSTLSAAIALRKKKNWFERGALSDITDLQQAVIRATLLDMDYAIAVYLDAGKRQRQATLSQITAFEETVGQILTQVTESVEGLNGTAGNLSAISEQVKNQSNAVSTASENSSINVQTVAAAAEELVAAISEISRQVTDAANIAAAATDNVSQTSRQIEGLSGAAENIGQVVGLINNIASQTNLLALNATIEAARAGEHGKGFAVVATEVKQLASETAAATKTISDQIVGIQKSTEQSVASINGISEIIESLNRVSASIASAVSQQRGATQEISQNIQEVANGASEVTRNIGGVAKAAGETDSAARFVLQAANHLTHKATELGGEVGNLLAQARAAQ